jgi:anti-sigma B factor antagonist
MAVAEFFSFQLLDSVNLIEFSFPPVIDAVEFDRINESVLELIDGKTAQPWIVDFAQVDYMGSAMLGLMVNIRQRIKSAGGQLALCNVSPRLTSIIRACSMDRLFKIARTRGDAIRLLVR